MSLKKPFAILEKCAEEGGTSYTVGGDLCRPGWLQPGVPTTGVSTESPLVWFGSGTARHGSPAWRG